MYKYFSAPYHDPLALKIAVVAIFILDLAQFASIVDFSWWYLVRNWGNLGAVTVVRISYGLAVAFSTPVILIVQLVYIYRIYRLNPGVKAIWIPLAVLLCLVVLESAFGWRGSAFGLTTIPFTQANHESGSQAYVVGLWLGAGVAADIGIASALTYNLSTRKTGFRKTDTLITKLVLYTINTTAFTSIIAVTDIICFYAMPQNNVHLGLNMLLCKLFSNSLLASLNSRTERRHQEETTANFAMSSTFGVTVHTMKDTFSDSQTVQASRSHFSDKEHSQSFNDTDVELYPIQKSDASAV